MRNPAIHDSRVLREAKTLSELGYRPLIVAVVSTEEQTRQSIVAGVPILRAPPSSPFAWIRSRLNRFRRRRAPAEAAAANVSGVADGSGGGPRVLVIRMHRWIRTIDFYRRAFKLVRAVRPAILHCNDYNTMWVGRRSSHDPRHRGGLRRPRALARPEPPPASRRWWLLACESLFLRLPHTGRSRRAPGTPQVMARRYRVSLPQVIRNIPASALRPLRTSDPVAAAGRPERVRLRRRAGLCRRAHAEPRAGALDHALWHACRMRACGSSGRVARRLSLASSSSSLQSEGVSDRVEFAAPVPPGKVVGVDSRSAAPGWP